MRDTDEAAAAGPWLPPDRDTVLAGRRNIPESILRELNADLANCLRRGELTDILYEGLNARLLAFNVDPAFGHALDGLMLVDLLDVEPALLARYMGASESAAFRAYHSPSAPLDSRPEAVRVPSVG